MTSSAQNQRRVLVSPRELLGYEIDGKYRLDSIIGGGGMGMVFRTTQQNLNRPVATKLLKFNLGDSQRSQDRFRREIDIISRMTHPNIVRVFDSGIDPELGLHFIVMELVDGISLDLLVECGRFAPNLAVEIAYGICAALTEPHRLGIVHRDIKPGNILLTVQSDDTLGVKVLDFGISRAIQVEEDDRVTGTGEIVGSPRYMAPEAARGVDVDARTDLYAVGVLLHEMLSGQPLFHGPTPVSVMLQHLGKEPPSLADLIPPDLVPAELFDLIDALLAKKIEDRPKSARDVLRRLGQIRQTSRWTPLRLEQFDSPIDALRPWIKEQEAPSTQHIDGSAPATTPFVHTSETTLPRERDDHAHADPSFDGWLVPASANLSLDEQDAGSPTFSRSDSSGAGEPTDEIDDAASTTPYLEAPNRRSRRRGIILAVVVAAALAAGVAATLAWVTVEDSNSTVPLDDSQPEEPKADEARPVAEDPAQEDLAQPSPDDEPDREAVDDDVRSVGDGSPAQPVPATSDPPTADSQQQQRQQQPARRQPTRADSEKTGDEDRARPAIDKPVAGKPAADEPAAEKPAAEKPAAEKQAPPEQTSPDQAQENANDNDQLNEGLEWLRSR